MNLSDSWTAQQPAYVRVSAAEAVFNSLRKAIEGGHLRVGIKLSSETTLSRQYGVSRSVVREALRSLNTLGLTVTRTGTGTFVIADRVATDLQLGRYSARELLEARPHIEIPAAGLAAQRRSEEDVQGLRNILSKMSNEDDARSWVELDSAFHTHIARASGNRVFESFIADIREALVSQSETLTLVGGRQSASDLEHQHILSALEQRSVQGAEDAMRQHLSGVRDSIVEILQNTPQDKDQ